MMSIKVYFGPKKHTPADELPADERFLWLRDFHLLRGIDRDFWTNNPFQLDVFEASQIMLWSPDERWVALEDVASAQIQDATLANLSNGQAALLCEMMWEGLRRQAEAMAEQQTQP